MSKEVKSIHEFDLELIVDYYSLVERQGPGSPEITKKALSFIDNLSSQSQIVDLGCGTGGQTIVLAQNTSGSIRGYDIFPKFINLFNKNVEKHNLQNRVQGIIGSMDDLPFNNEELDLIWSEGAIYNIGFERGLKEWRKYLKSGGFVAVSEASWFTNERPKEIYDFWMDAYPEIDTIPKKLSQMQNAGYVPVASFILPESCWLDEFYVPQVKADKKYLLKHKGNQAAEDFIANQRHEEGLYRRYKAFYGYVFYIGKKL